MAKHRIQEILENLEYTCREYSGRNMFGVTCLGVEYHDSLPLLIADIIENMIFTQRGALADAIRNMKTDEMGKGYIAYFPYIPYSHDETK